MIQLFVVENYLVTFSKSDAMQKLQESAVSVVKNQRVTIQGMNWGRAEVWCERAGDTRPRVHDVLSARSRKRSLRWLPDGGRHDLLEIA